MSFSRGCALLVFGILAFPLAAAEHRGTVLSNTLPIPGASVTARQGETRLTTTTGDDGAYSFIDLAPGTWTIEIEMHGFVKLSGEVRAPGEASEWALAVEGAVDRPMAAPHRVPTAAAAQGKYAERSLSATAPVREAGDGDDIPTEWAASANEAILVGSGAPATRGRAGPRYSGSFGVSLDSSVWDARAYSITGQKMEKPPFAKARANVSFGGPLRIPKLISGERTNFTVSMNAGRTRNWTSFTSTMPSEGERRGDFSQSVQRGPVSIRDPLSGQAFPGSRIPESRMDTAAWGLMRYMPLPNQPGAVQNYQFVAVAPFNSDSVNASVNHRFGRSVRLSGALSHNRSDSLWQQLIGVADSNTGRGWNANLTLNATLAPRVISTTRFSFSLRRYGTVPYFANRDNVAAELGITGTATDPVNWGPPNLSFTNFGGVSAANASRSADQTGTISESVAWNRGTHGLSFGVDYSRRQMNRVADRNARGSLSFTGLATSGPGAEGFDFADFVLGLPNTSSVRFGGGDTYFRAKQMGLYFQDDWRAAAGFTLNFGLRYDYASPVWEKYGRMANLAIEPGFTGARPVLGPETLVQPDRNNFSPRAAIAWRPAARLSAVVRAGYGWYFNSNIYSGVADNLAQQPPFANASTVASSSERVLTIRDAFRGTVTRRTANTYAVDRRYRVGYAQSWNLSIEQNLGRVLVGEFTYLGTKGSGLDMLSIPNRALPQSVAPFIYESSDGNSIFHAGSARIARRFSGGFTGQFRYTYGKSIDNASSVTGSGSGWIVQDAFNFAAERGLSSFDNRHVVDANWQFSSGKRVRMAFRDWALSSTVSYRSGAPLTATVLGNRADVAGTGITGTVRADATGLPVRGGYGFFNPAAFAVPAEGMFGNAGRGTIPGPPMFVMNGSVARSISLGERRALELRLDGMNILNRVNITRWGTVVNASNFGMATGAAAMRNLNASVRVRF
jgi:trimeric autotransporter adhesin